MKPDQAPSDGKKEISTISRMENLHNLSQEANLRNIDLNLLTIFESVYQEQSQVKASERLNMTQSAISHALARLRHIVGDRLFLGRQKGLTPTPVADSLYTRVHEALSLIRLEFYERATFIPETSQRIFNVAMSYGSGGGLATILYKIISEKAPSTRLVIRHIDPSDQIPGMLREHRIDVAFHYDRFDDVMLEQIPALENEFSIIASKDHPRIQSDPDIEALMKESYVTVYRTDQLSDHSEAIQGMIDNITSRCAMEVPSAFIQPVVVENTELLAIVPAKFGKHFTSRYRLASYPLPVNLPKVHSHLIWHKSMATDLPHTWLREQCLEAIRIYNADGYIP